MTSQIVAWPVTFRFVSEEGPFSAGGLPIVVALTLFYGLVVVLLERQGGSERRRDDVIFAAVTLAVWTAVGCACMALVSYYFESPRGQATLDEPVLLLGLPVRIVAVVFGVLVLASVCFTYCWQCLD